MKTILATGGAGYVGSHVAVALMAAGCRVVILDDFSNAAVDVVDRIDRIGPGRVALVRGDVRDETVLDAVFGAHRIDAVLHLAGPRAGEGDKPGNGEGADASGPPPQHEDVNVAGAGALLAAMGRHGVGRLVFFSTATVYGAPGIVPIPESSPPLATDPHSRGKLAVEGMIDALVRADPGFAAISLRCYSPAGAHSSGLLGEEPGGEPTNLLPYIAQTASGLREQVPLFGDDHPTEDGTEIRDYIHVMDLAEGHVAALRHLFGSAEAVGRHRAVNLGTGQGISGFEALAAFRRVVGFEIPFRIAARRPGDAPVLVADPRRAAALLGWRATRGIERICADLWAFQRRRLAERSRLAGAR